MNSLEVLTKTRKMLENPEHWTKRAYARDAAGHLILSVTNRAAVSFDLSGAGVRVIWQALTQELGRWPSKAMVLPLFHELVEDPLNAAVVALHPEHDNLDDFNDGKDTTHADVLAVLDKAIEQAR